MRGGRGGVTGQSDGPAQQAGHSHQAAGGGRVPHRGKAEAAPGQDQQGQHQHPQHQPAGILPGTQTGDLEYHDVVVVVVVLRWNI